MTSSSLSTKKALEIAIQVAKEAGEILLDHFHSDKRVMPKEGRSNVVSDVDLLTEKRMIELLQREYPSHGIVSEESKGIQGESSYTWILDPLDGTNNYVAGIPFFSTCVALVREQEILLGLVYDPIRGELFRAEKGRGAFLNDLPISVGQKTTVKTSIIGCDLGYSVEGGRRMLESILALWPGLHTARIMGSAALGLAYVASGRLDLYIHPGLYPWDVASGILLIREAGGKITDWEGKPATIHSPQVVAANNIVHKEFMKVAKYLQSSVS